MNTQAASEKWACEPRDVREWCKAGQIPGAEKQSGRWVIPETARRPPDRKLQREIIWWILEASNGLKGRLDLTSWGIKDTDIQIYLYSCMESNLIRFAEGNRDVLQITEAGFNLVKTRTSKSTEATVYTPPVLKLCLEIAPSILSLINQYICSTGIGG
jgi:hypothetical protein